MTPQEHQTDILDKIDRLKNYIDRFSVTLSDTDFTKPSDNIDNIENAILIIQGQKEFVKMSLQDMKDEYANI